MQSLWDIEELVAHFQAIARGRFAREIFGFRFAMDHSTRRFQAVSKAFLVRRALSQKQTTWRDNKREIITVQSLWRGRQQRAQTARIRTHLQKNKNGLKELQAAIRGAIGRWRTVGSLGRGYAVMHRGSRSGICGMRSGFVVRCTDFHDRESATVIGNSGSSQVRSGHSIRRDSHAIMWTW